MTTAQANAEYWATRYANAGEFATVGRRSFDDRDFWRQAAEVWSIAGPHARRDGGRVLDYGCGVGRFVPYLMGFADDYVGVDLCPIAVQSAQRRFSSPHVWFDLAHGGSMAWEGPRFDLIWCCTVLQHIVDDDLLNNVIHQFASRTDAGARLVLLEAVGPQSTTATHIVFRSQAAYELMLARAGFRVVHASGHRMREPHALIVAERSRRE